MSRTLVEIPKESLFKLDSIAKKQHVSRASLIRTAIDQFLKNQQQNTKNAFGILKHKKIDPLEIQIKLRDEWK